MEGWLISRHEFDDHLCEAIDLRDDASGMLFAVHAAQFASRRTKQPACYRDFSGFCRKIFWRCKIGERFSTMLQLEGSFKPKTNFSDRRKLKVIGILKLAKARSGNFILHSENFATEPRQTLCRIHLRSICAEYAPSATLRYGSRLLPQSQQADRMAARTFQQLSGNDYLVRGHIGSR
jgi:hypothetical protein